MKRAFLIESHPPNETESSHAHGLQIGVPIRLSIQGDARMVQVRGGEIIPAGDLESRAKDLGTYKLGHGDLMAEAA